jgi:protein-disulfide isomerase
MSREKKSFFKSLNKNPWIISTAVLAGVILVLLFVGGAASGKVISEDKAKNLVQGFVDSQVAGAQVTSIAREGNFYKADVSIEGQNVPVYLTLDGKEVVVNIIPLEEIDSTPSTGSNEQAPQEIVKSDKPQVELFVMSHCPYGTQSMKGIIPAVKAFGDTIDFDLRFVNYAMHGEREVREQIDMYCIREEQNDKLLDYLECFLGTTKGSEEEAAACRVEVGIDQKKLDSCVTNANEEFNVEENLADKSSQFPKFLTDDSLNIEYAVRGSPTLVINGEQVSSSRSPSAYGEVICEAFNNAPELCGSMNLDSATPGPGFGYTTTTSETTAQC